MDTLERREPLDATRSGSISAESTTSFYFFYFLAFDCFLDFLTTTFFLLLWSLAMLLIFSSFSISATPIASLTKIVDFSYFKIVDLSFFKTIDLSYFKIRDSLLILFSDSFPVIIFTEGSELIAIVGGSSLKSFLLLLLESDMVDFLSTSMTTSEFLTLLTALRERREDEEDDDEELDNVAVFFMKLLAETLPPT